MSEDEARRIVTARALGRCESCGKSGPLEFSHRKARSQQGKWSPVNGIAACRTCHAYFHANPEESREMGWFVSGSVPDEKVGEQRVRLLTWLGRGWYYLLPWGGYDVISLDGLDATMP